MGLGLQVFVLIIAPRHQKKLKFRELFEIGVQSVIQHSCLFCDVQTTDRQRIVAENELAYAIRDGFPVTEGHTLVIPKRHVLDFFGLTEAELLDMNRLLHSEKEVLTRTYPEIGGFNVGANCGEIAGQSVWHCHLHLIPRRKGDVERPKGGVRHVIPNKGHYEAK
jgi:diadenosine tetraphosphate (Ap4A) HIT family hydrolase